MSKGFADPGRYYPATTEKHVASLSSSKEKKPIVLTKTVFVKYTSSRNRLQSSNRHTKRAKGDLYNCAPLGEKETDISQDSTAHMNLLTRALSINISSACSS